MITLINGSGGVGKDTFVSYCGNFANIKNISVVDPVKEIATICGWDGTKNDDTRLMLNKVLEWFEHRNVINNYLDMEIEKYMYGGYDILFIHARDIDKYYTYLHGKYDINIVRLLISNNRIKPIETNVADKNVSNFDYDEIISNNGTYESLLQDAKIFIEKHI